VTPDAPALPGDKGAEGSSNNLPHFLNTAAREQ